jgi:hypothetical protein
VAGSTETLTRLGLLYNIVEHDDVVRAMSVMCSVGIPGKDWVITAGSQGVEAIRLREGAGKNLLRDEQIAKIEAAFRVLDADGSGEMDPDEFAKGVAMLGLEVTAEGVLCCSYPTGNLSLAAPGHSLVCVYVYVCVYFCGCGCVSLEVDELTPRSPAKVKVAQSMCVSVNQDELLAHDFGSWI